LPDVPKVVTPGNHDVPLYRVVERWQNPFGLYRRYISNELDRVWRSDQATIVGLNSTSPRSAITNGRIHSGQLDFCAKAFASDCASSAKIVVAHHHFAPAPDYGHDQTMPKAKRAMKRFVEMGVELILGGHLHRSYIGNSLDIYPSLESGHQGIIIVQCGTTTSRRGRVRERDQNTLNVIDFRPNTLHVTHYMYFDDTGCFEAINNHDFPRRGKRLPNGTPSRDR
jgi:3',5'-cyclic AMP phosphodiesterase CpdA